MNEYSFKKKYRIGAKVRIIKPLEGYELYFNHILTIKGYYSSMVFGVTSFLVEENSIEWYPEEVEILKEAKVNFSICCITCV